MASIALLGAALGLAVRAKVGRPGGSFEPPAREPPGEAPQPRDVVLKVYDIATPAVAQTLSLLTNKPVRWFPKLTVSVGSRTWSYDGEVERTVDAIVENAAGGPALRTLNAGPCLLATDAEVDALLDSMGATDYTPEEYDFFYRNCNHFCLDLTERLAGVERLAAHSEWLDTRVLDESNSLLSKMPEFQQSLTRGVTRQVQKVIVKAWRKEWKRALAEYAEENGDPELAAAVGPLEDE